MKIYRIAASNNTVYHVTNKDFESIGGKSGIGIHVATSQNSAEVFAEINFSENFTIMEFTLNMKNPLKCNDVGVFNSPQSLLQEFVKNKSITEEEFKSLAIGFGANEAITSEECFWFNQDFKFGDNISEDFFDDYGKGNLEFLNKHGLSYESWEPVRKFLLEKGYDGLEYMNDSDAPGTCYVVFYPSQLNLIEKKKYTSLDDVRKEEHLNEIMQGYGIKDEQDLAQKKALYDDIEARSHRKESEAAISKQEWDFYVTFEDFLYIFNEVKNRQT